MYRLIPDSQALNQRYPSARSASGTWSMFANCLCTVCSGRVAEDCGVSMLLKIWLRNIEDWMLCKHSFASVLRCPNRWGPGRPWPCLQHPCKGLRKVPLLVKLPTASLPLHGHMLHAPPFQRGIHFWPWSLFSFKTCQRWDVWDVWDVWVLKRSARNPNVSLLFCTWKKKNDTHMTHPSSWPKEIVAQKLG